MTETSPTLLLVEDALGFRETLALEFRDRGYEVAEAGSGAGLATVGSEGHTSDLRKPHSAQFPNSTTSERLSITDAYQKQKTRLFQAGFFFK